MTIDVSQLALGTLGFALTGLVGWIVKDLRAVTSDVKVITYELRHHKERIDKEEERGDHHAVAIAEIKGCKSART